MTTSSLSHCKYCHETFNPSTAYDYNKQQYMCPSCGEGHDNADIQKSIRIYDGDVFGYEKKGTE